MLAHAIAQQSRGDEALKTLEPAMAYYRKQLQTGSKSTLFRRDFAYALYVSALAQDDNAQGRAKRAANLAEATKLLDGLSAEAKQLAYMRLLSGWIAQAKRS